MIRHRCTRNHKNSMSLIFWIHNILGNVGLSSKISPNLYHSLSYSLSYSLHKKFDIYVHKCLLMILTIKVITQKFSNISYILIFLFKKKRYYIVYKTYPQKNLGKMRNLSTISLCSYKFDIFFPPLYFAIETRCP